MQRFIKLWNTFWFAESDTKNLSILRILFGIILFLKMINFPGIFRFSAERKFFLGQGFSADTYYLEGFHHAAYGFNWLPVPSLLVWQLIELGVALLAVLFAFGVFMRVVGPLTSTLYGFLFLSTQFVFHHHMFLLFLMLFILGFSRSADHYSFDAWKKRSMSQWTPEKRFITPLRMAQVLLSVIYVFGTASKLNAGWYDGAALESVFVYEYMLGTPLTPVILSVISFPAISAITIIVELLLVIGLWMRRTRTLAIILGIVFHLGIDATLAVDTYSYEMMALYTAFIKFKKL